MEDAIVTLLAFLLAPVVLVSLVAVTFVARLRRTNRVGPGASAGQAPFSWLWSPGVAASLHRRLRSASQLASTVAGPPPARWAWRRGSMALPAISVHQLARDVMAEAVRVDREVVAARFGPPGMPRAYALGALEVQVCSVEDAARRVHSLAHQSVAVSGPGGPAALSLQERIASLEAAMGELRARP